MSVVTEAMRIVVLEKYEKWSFSCDSNEVPNLMTILTRFGGHRVTCAAGIRKMKCNIILNEATPIFRIDSTYTVDFVELVTADGTSVRTGKGKKEISYEDLRAFRQLSFTEVSLVFDSGNQRPLNVKLHTIGDEVEMPQNPFLLHPCEETLTIQCSDGTVNIDPVLAMANSQHIRMILQNNRNVVLPEHSTTTVTRVKEIMRRRVVPEDITAKDVALMQYLLFKDCDVAWDRLCANIRVENCFEIGHIAALHDHTRTKERAEAFFRENIASFEIVDFEALAGAVEAKRRCL